MAMTLAADCYRLTAGLPREEMYSMTAQIRRAAVSVPANVAEGHGRENTGSFVQFLRIAQGSLKELDAFAARCPRNTHNAGTYRALARRVPTNWEDASRIDKIAAGRIITR
jgi:four helix bundle protein